MWKHAQTHHDDAIVSLCKALNEEDPGTHPVPESHVRRTLEALRLEPTRGRALILELGGQVSGYAFLITFWSNEVGGEILFVDELYVHPDQRGKGHSKWLFKDLLGASTVWPRSWVAVELEVSPSNARAQKLYTSLGLSPVRNGHMRKRLK